MTTKHIQLSVDFVDMRVGDRTQQATLLSFTVPGDSGMAGIRLPQFATAAEFKKMFNDLIERLLEL